MSKVESALLLERVGFDGRDALKATHMPILKPPSAASEVKEEAAEAPPSST